MRAPLLRLEMTLRDGTPVLIRPILPEDKGALRAGLRELSPESRYRRFAAPMEEFTDAQLRYLSEIDYRNHMAWVALDRSETHGLGVARYVRLPPEPEVAEAAVAVIDEFHGRGLGTLLLGVLAAGARANGIAAFRAYVLAENRPMLALFRELEATPVPDGAGLLRVDLEIPEDPDDLPDTPVGRVFKGVAKDVLPPVVTRRIWRAGD